MEGLNRDSNALLSTNPTKSSLKCHLAVGLLYCFMGLGLLCHYTGLYGLKVTKF